MLDIFDVQSQILNETVNEAEKGYVDPDQMRPETVILIKELVSVQNKIRKINDKVDALKSVKKGLEPSILADLARLNAAGVRVGKILVYVRNNVSSPSFKAVLEQVQKKLDPKVTELLQKTYEKLTKDLPPSLGVNEDAGWLDKVKSFFASIFSPAVKDIDSTLKGVESMLGMNESAVQFVTGVVRSVTERKHTLCEEYQGWTNYQTWQIAVLLDNVRSVYDGVMEIVNDIKKDIPEGEKRSADSYSDAEVKLADKIKEYVDDIVETGIDALPNGSSYPFIPDLVKGALAEVEYREIARSYLDN